MQSSASPSKIQLPFANAGSKNTIPVASQIVSDPALASFTDGFPPATRTPLAAGGKPPYGQDMNGILYAITAIQQWQCAGGMFKYDSAFATSIGGYPKGAVLSSANGLIHWRNFAEGNTTDPDGATPSGWVAIEGSLANFVSYQASQTITLAQAGSLIGYASTTGAGTFTLPSPVGQAGLNYTFTNYSNYNLTITTPNGVFTRGGGGTSITLTPGSGVVIASDNVNWQLLHGDASLQYSPLFGASKVANGYQKLPNGIILQWGQFSQNDTAGNATPYTFTLPTTFPTGCLQAFITPGNNITSSAQPVVGSAEGLNASNITGYTYSASTITRTWRIFAIGY